MENKVLGHEFLASLGKKRLRPGGVKGTNYLIKYIKDNYKNEKDLNILEVSCNRGYSLIYLAKKLKSNFYGVDINPEIVKIAKNNINKNGLEDRVKIYEMNAMKMDFNGMKFDIIINEALLTMCKDKNVFLNEYYKHLNDGGILLTHDICIINEKIDYPNEMRDIINLKPHPLTIENWKKTFDQSKFKVVDFKTFNFSLVTIKGLIKDEGIFNMIKIIINANKQKNRNDFKNMRKFFKENRNDLKAICTISKKIN